MSKHVERKKYIIFALWIQWFMHISIKIDNSAENIFSMTMLYHRVILFIGDFRLLTHQYIFFFLILFTRKNIFFDMKDALYGTRSDIILNLYLLQLFRQLLLEHEHDMTTTMMMVYSEVHLYRLKFKKKKVFYTGA